MHRVGFTVFAGTALLLLANSPLSARQNPPGGPVTPRIDVDGAYLFAHMTRARYGVLHYSVSRDGLHWRSVNGGRPVSADYHGHASIARGGDGRYYLVGNRSDDDPLIRFWVSDDLIRWAPYGTYRPDLSAVPGHPHPLQRIGAPGWIAVSATTAAMLALAWAIARYVEPVLRRALAGLFDRIAARPARRPRIVAPR